jgi:hypothetical protein
VRAGCLELLLATPELSSPQGVTVTPDGKRLLVTDYSQGLFAVDLASLDLRALPAPDGVTTLGIDGIYLLGDRTVVGVQNGITPTRVVRLELDAGFTRVVALTPLLANHPEVDDPTLGALAGNDFFLNATGQWRLFDDAGALTEPAALRDLLVLRIPVGPTAAP